MKHKTTKSKQYIIDKMLECGGIEKLTFFIDPFGRKNAVNRIVDKWIEWDILQTWERPQKKRDKKTKRIIQNVDYSHMPRNVAKYFETNPFVNFILTIHESLTMEQFIERSKYF